MASSPTLVGPVTILGIGYLGRALACALAERELTVTGISLHGRWAPAPDEGLPDAAPSACHLYAFDLLQGTEEALAARIQGVRALVCCVAPDRSQRGAQQDRRRLYVDALALALRSAARCGLARAILVSSTSALPDLDDWLDETCPTWPDDERGRIQRESEASFVAHARELDLDWLVLRCAGLYGPGRPLARLTGRMASGDPLRATNLIHRDDAVAAILAALRADIPSGHIVHVCDDDHSPRARVRASVHGEETSEPLPLVGRGKKVQNEKLRSFLGVELQYPRHSGR